MTTKQYRNIFGKVPFLRRYLPKTIEKAAPLYPHICAQLIHDQADFERTIAPVLVAADVDIATQKTIVDCLKYRKGERIPAYVTVEDSAELRHVMSFGLIMSIVVEQYFNDRQEPSTPDAVAVIYLNELVPPRTLDWLKSYPVALHEVIKYLTMREKSCYTNIIDRVLNGEDEEPEKHHTDNVLEYIKSMEGQTDTVFRLDDGGLFVACPEGLQIYAESLNIDLRQAVNRLKRPTLHRLNKGSPLFEKRGYQGLILDLKP